VNQPPGGWSLLRSNGRGGCGCREERQLISSAIWQLMTDAKAFRTFGLLRSATMSIENSVPKVRRPDEGLIRSASGVKPSPTRQTHAAGKKPVGLGLSIYGP
jgi:hypothetical protein